MNGKSLISIIKGFFQRNRDGFEDSLCTVLRSMDATAEWYSDEDEANRELVSCLKVLGFQAIYHHTLPNGRTVDAKVYGNLIEGKLSPETAEVDRLIGQLTELAKFNRVYIVVYGPLDRHSEERIKGEIHDRYQGRVSLICLEDPKRRRKPNSNHQKEQK
jgi:hypothetical protein